MAPAPVAEPMLRQCAGRTGLSGRPLDTASNGNRSPPKASSPTVGGTGSLHSAP